MAHRGWPSVGDCQEGRGKRATCANMATDTVTMIMRILRGRKPLELMLGPRGSRCQHASAGGASLTSAWVRRGAPSTASTCVGPFCGRGPFSMLHSSSTPCEPPLKAPACLLLVMCLGTCCTFNTYLVGGIRSRPTAQQGKGELHRMGLSLLSMNQFNQNEIPMKSNPNHTHNTS